MPSACRSASAQTAVDVPHPSAPPLPVATSHMHTVMAATRKEDYGADQVLLLSEPQKLQLKADIGRAVEHRVFKEQICQRPPEYRNDSTEKHDYDDVLPDPNDLRMEVQNIRDVAVHEFSAKLSVPSKETIRGKVADEVCTRKQANKQTLLCAREGPRGLSASTV